MWDLRKDLKRLIFALFPYIWKIIREYVIENMLQTITNLQIFSLRTLPDQLVGLLRDSSILPQIQSSIESAMRNFNPCVYTLAEADQTQWRMRLNSAEKGIDGLMERAIPELRARLQPSQADLNGVYFNFH